MAAALVCASCSTFLAHNLPKQDLRHAHPSVPSKVRNVIRCSRPALSDSRRLPQSMSRALTSCERRSGSPSTRRLSLESRASGGPVDDSPATAVQEPFSLVSAVRLLEVCTCVALVTGTFSNVCGPVSMHQASPGQVTRLSHSQAISLAPPSPSQLVK